MSSTKIYGLAGVLAIGALGACSDASGPSKAQQAISPNLSGLTVGQTRILTLAQAAGGLVIPKGGGSATYLVTLTNLSVVDTASSIPHYVPSGDLAGADPTLSMRPSLDVSARGVAASSWMLPGIRQTVAPRHRLPFGPAFMRAEARLRHFATRDVVPAIRRSRALRASRTLPMRRTINPTQAGDSVMMRTPVNGCFEPVDSTKAYVKAISNHAIVLSDSASPSGGFTDDDFNEIASEFDALTYNTVTSNFGTPTDFDGNGKVVIFFTPYVNSLSSSNPSDGYVGGVFFPGDLLLPEICPESNDGEVFYLVTPDPNSTVSQPFTRADVFSVAFGTMAHEFVHMINAGHKISDPSEPPLEAAWLDEGLAHMSEHVVGRAAMGISNQTLLDVDALQGVSDDIWYSYFSENFGRAYIYMQRPDTTGPIVNEDRIENSLGARGGIWSLLQFADDQYSHGDRQAFLRNLTLSSDTGIVNLLAQVGVPVDTLLTHWQGALAAESQLVPGLGSGFGYNSYAWGDIFSALQVGGISHYPLPIVLVDGSVQAGVGVPGSSGASFRIVQSSSQARHVQFTVNTGTTVDPNIRVVVTRVQ